MTPSEAKAAPKETYRRLSTHAVVSAVFGGLSLLAWISPPLVAVATIAAICGGIAVVRLQGRSADVAGIRLAMGGLAVSSICLMGASVWHWHRYTIEVPEGYQRVELTDIFSPQSGHSTAEWVLDERRWRDEPTDEQRIHVSPTALQLDGHRIAVKGYVDPIASHEPVSAFTMSRLGWTGFGSKADPGEQLNIQLANGDSTDYFAAPVVVSGVFHIETDSSNGKTQVRLVLKNAVVRPATSSIGLSPRNGGDC
jgi:hypothetical protein